jgi:peptide deformylase
MNIAPVQCDPILLWSPKLQNRQCEPVCEFGNGLHDLIERMKRTMFYYNGVGLSAPQIGVFKKIAIIDWNRRILPLFNPEIVEGNGDAVGWEGCLSLPGANSHRVKKKNEARVHRLTKLTINYQNINGHKVTEEFKDFEARIIQHEVDHLSGVFFIDRCGPLFRDVVLRNMRKMEFQAES